MQHHWKQQCNTTNHPRLVRGVCLCVFARMAQPNLVVVLLLLNSCSFPGERCAAAAAWYVTGKVDCIAASYSTQLRYVWHCVSQRVCIACSSVANATACRTVSLLVFAPCGWPACVLLSSAISNLATCMLMPRLALRGNQGLL